MGAACSRLSLRSPSSPSSPTTRLPRRRRRALIDFVRPASRTLSLCRLAPTRTVFLDRLPISELAPARAAPHFLVFFACHNRLGKVLPRGKGDRRAVCLEDWPARRGVSCHMPSCGGPWIEWTSGTYSSEAYTATSQSIGARDRSSDILSERASASGQGRTEASLGDGWMD